MTYRKPQKPASKLPKYWPFWDPPPAKRNPVIDEIDQVIWETERGSKMSGSTKTVPLAIAAIGIVVLFFLGMFHGHQDRRLRENCTASGGSVLATHDGRGGWVCLPGQIPPPAPPPGTRRD